MKVVWVLLVTLLVACCASVPSYQTVHSLALRLDINGTTVCSGTAVGTHTILTAEHCFIESGDPSIDGKYGPLPLWVKALKVDGRAATITSTVRDGHDHVLLTVNLTFLHVAYLGTTPRQGAEVFLYGNPASIPDMLIFGRFAGRYRGADLYDINSWHGDSGAAVYDLAGRIVGVVSRGALDWRQGEGTWKMMVGYPVLFTQAQLSGA